MASLTRDELLILYHGHVLMRSTSRYPYIMMWLARRNNQGS